MSQFDSEINSLRLRLAALEEQKRNETEREAEKKEFPLKTFEDVVLSLKYVRRGGSNKFQNERYLHARGKLEYLEPIFNVLKNIQERLEVLEKGKPT